MADRLRVACVQFCASGSKAENLERMEPLVARAAATGADLVLLPEKWNGIGTHEIILDVAEPLDSGESVAAMSAWAKQHGITLVGGSIVERREGARSSRTRAWSSTRGRDRGDLPEDPHVRRRGRRPRLPRVGREEPGEGPMSCEVEGWRLGLTVCYDLRFPELYRILAVEGAEIVTVPAAFTLYTGKDHWELLLRARAVENQCFVAAANQWGVHEGGKASYGRSSIIDPWGVVLAQAPDEDAVISAELDRAHLERIRRSLPSLANRQPAAYTWPAEV